jgi:hypothetical protein
MTSYRSLWSGLIMLALLLAGCSSTTMGVSWKSPEYTGQIKKVYIIGIARQELTRRIFEDQFSRQLSPYGVTGISSYRDLQADQEANEEMITDKVRANGADSVLMSRVVGKRTEEVVNPGRISSYDNGPRYSGRGGYYPGPYSRSYGNYYSRSREIIYQPATVSEFEVVTIEANLYDAATSELIWSAQLETVVEGNMDKLITDFIEIVTKDLKEKGLI